MDEGLHVEILKLTYDGQNLTVASCDHLPGENSLPPETRQELQAVVSGKKTFPDATTLSRLLVLGENCITVRMSNEGAIQRAFCFRPGQLPDIFKPYCQTPELPSHRKIWGHVKRMGESGLN
jgi:hypothetical protein